MLKYHGTIWYTFPDCGTRTSMDVHRGCLFPGGLWLAVVISYSFSMVAWMIAPLSWRLFGTMEMHMPRELPPPPPLEIAPLLSPPPPRWWRRSQSDGSPHWAAT